MPVGLTMPLSLTALQYSEAGGRNCIALAWACQDTGEANAACTKYAAIFGAKDLLGRAGILLGCTELLSLTASQYSKAKGCNCIALAYARQDPGEANAVCSEYVAIFAPKDLLGCAGILLACVRSCVHV